MANSLVLKVAISPQHSPELYASLAAISDPRTRTAMLRMWAEAGLGGQRTLPLNRKLPPEAEQLRHIATPLDPGAPRAVITVAPVSPSTPPSVDSDRTRVDVEAGLHPSLAGLDIDALGAAVGDYGG